MRKDHNPMSTYRPPHVARELDAPRTPDTAWGIVGLVTASLCMLAFFLAAWVML